MIENIKKRIIHFNTHGNIIEDFVEARRHKAVKLRRIIRVCFYIQCAAAVGCVATAFALGAGAAAAAVIVGSAAVCAVAFMAMGGGSAEKTILYMLDLVYAVICFIAGGLGEMAAFVMCGIIMIIAALAALIGFFASWCRQYLMDFSPSQITRSDYTRLTLSFAEQPTAVEEPILLLPPPLPPPPPKTEMEQLAERLAGIFKTAPATAAKPDGLTDKSEDNAPNNPTDSGAKQSEYIQNTEKTEN